MEKKVQYENTKIIHHKQKENTPYNRRKKRTIIDKTPLL